MTDNTQVLSVEERGELRELLCLLGSAVQRQVNDQRAGIGTDELSKVSTIFESDTIYAIDRISEEALLNWFEENWPSGFPVEIVAEGLEDKAPVIFPRGTRVQNTIYKVIIDPIDGTRELMYDKRSAWVLAGASPQRFEENCISDIEVAMMTELPISKQHVADQVSGYLGCKREGIVATRHDLATGESSPFELRPSSSKNVDHGVAGFVKFFPEAKDLISRFETDLWTRLGLYGRYKSPLVFDDQYISTGGQMYGVLVGHYRLYGDIRPEALKTLGLGNSLTCHPYDLAAGLLLREAGCVYQSPWGGELKAPIDTISPVSWVAYANQDMAALIHPVVQAMMEEYFAK